MILYLPDTNACIRVLNRSSPRLIKRLRQLPCAAIVMSSIVKAELFYGARGSARMSDNLLLLSRFFEPYATVAFDDLCAETYGVIRADLRRAGTLIGPNDLLIAATARAHDLTLVTHNLGEFSRVPGLRLEDWERES